MADKSSKDTEDEQSKVRKHIKVVEEVVDDSSSDDGEESDEATSGGKRDYKTERKAGSKVRVARSTQEVDTPSTSRSDDGPGRRAVSVDNQKQVDAPEAPPEDAADETGSEASGAAEPSAQAPADRPASDKPAATEQSTQRSSDQSSSVEYTKDKPDVSTADFEAMLAGEQTAGAPQAANLTAGDRINAPVAAIGEKFLFVSVGNSKTEAVANREDFENEDGELEVAIGDEVDFYVLSVTGDEVELGKKLGGRQGALEAVRTARDTGVPIDGLVESTNKGGFEVKIGGIRAFCPVSQIELGYTEEPDEHVGETYRFQVQKVSDRGRNVVVSRRRLLEEERAERREETLESLEAGQTVTGKVTRVVDFGAFIDVGGVEGLAHVSELAHGSIDHPSDVIAPGDDVEVKVLNIDRQDDGDLRIGLSIKETQGNPWEQVNQTFSVGQTVDGEVVRLAPFGAFVAISAGLDGLVHVSEMSWKEHVKHPRDMVSVGDKVSVEIQDIDVARQRISLSMKAVEEDPWDSVAQRYSVGMEVTGTVENVEDFGAFVRLDSGVTALVPRSEMELPSGVTPHRKYDIGSQATARVLNVDGAERKMALTEKAADEINRSTDTKKSASSPSKSTSPNQSGYSDGDDAGGGFGTLGDLLGDKLNRD